MGNKLNWNFSFKKDESHAEIELIKYDDCHAFFLKGDAEQGENEKVPTIFEHAKNILVHCCIIELTFCSLYTAWSQWPSTRS